MKNRVLFLALLVCWAGNVSAQNLPETKSYDYDGVADRTVTVKEMDKLEIRVGEVVDVYCDSFGITDNFWEPSMSMCFVDHAWVFHSDGTANKHPNSRYVAISHIDPSIGLTRLFGLEPTDGTIWMEMYYSLSWRYPGSHVYVLQDDYDFQLKVYAIKPETVSLQEEKTLREGQSFVLEPTLTPSDAYSKYKWESDDEKVVTVDEDGKVTAVSEGRAIVTVTTDNGLSASCEINVVPAPDAISLSADFNIYVGYGYQLVPDLEPVESYADYFWYSSDKSVAKVNTSGYVTAVSAGTATVAVTADNGINASIEIYVEPAPEGLSAEEAKARIRIVNELVNRTL